MFWEEPMVVFPEAFLERLGRIPVVPRPMKVFDTDWRKKLLDLASFLVATNPVESTERTVKFLILIAGTDHVPDPVPFLEWQSTRFRSDVDLLSEFDPNHCKPIQRLLPQMRFTARLHRRWLEIKGRSCLVANWCSWFVKGKLCFDINGNQWLVYNVWHVTLQLFKCEIEDLYLDDHHQVPMRTP